MKKFKKKKYLLILPSIGLGGTEKILIQYYQILLKKNIDAKLCVIKKKKLYNYNLTSDFSVIYLNCQKSVNSFFKILKLIEKQKPNTIISSSLSINLILVFIKFFISHKFELIIREPNSPLEQFKYQKNLFIFFIRFFYNFADKVIAPSIFIKKTLEKFFFVNKKKIYQIPNPSLKIFKKHRVLKNSKYKFLNKKPFILSIGSLTKQKNFELLINSFSIFLKKYKKKFYLIIIGDGIQKDKLSILIKSLKLQNKIFLVGQTKKIDKYLNNCSIYCCSSLYEGMPNSIIEALQKNKIIITSDFQSGVKDLIKLGFKINISKKNSFTYSKNILSNINLTKKINNKKSIEKLNYLFETKFYKLINE